MIESKLCKYYNPHMNTIAAYVRCLYDLEGCIAGGMLHILLDDDNIDDHHILYCLEQCIKHPEKEESQIGKLICEEYLKLSFSERLFLASMLNGLEDPTCVELKGCVGCPHINYYGE